VIALIFGATRPEHVDAAVATLETGLDAKAIATISKAYEPRAAGA
jgi:aryl-alcohol dehydrogenase-like predicted oxidoreductase